MVADKKTYVVEYDLRKKGDGAAKAGKETETLRKETNKLSVAFKDAEGNARNLDDVLTELYADRAEAIRRYMETGDEDDRKRRNALGGQIRMVQAFKKELADAAKLGASAFAPIADSFKGGGIAMPIAITGAGAIVAGALPLLGAMVSGAFSGTVVGAAMAGGIAAASQDPAVRSAASQFGDRVSEEFFGSGKAFVWPIQQSLGVLADAVDDMNLGGAFAKVAPQLTTVADGVGRLGKNLMPGLNNALDRSAGFSEEFADGLSDMGGALGKMIDDMSSSEGAVEGLNALFKVVNGTLVAVGMGVNVLADGFDFATDVLGGFTDAMEEIPEPLQLLLFGHAGFSEMNDVLNDINKSTHGAAGGFVATSEALGGLAEITAAADEELRSLESTVGRLLEKTFGLEEAQDAAADAVAKLKEQLKEQREEGVKGAGSLTGDTQAARDNREAVRDLAEAYADLMVEQEQAGQSSDATKQQFEDLLVSMGFGRTEAKKYADSLREVKAELDKIKSKEITLTIRQKSEIGYLRNQSGGRNVIEGFEGRASGGPVMAGVPYTINERGTETVTFPASGTVHPASLTPAVSSFSGPADVRLSFQRSGNALLDFLIENLSAEVRKRGGGASVLGIRAL